MGAGFRVGSGWRVRRLLVTGVLVAGAAGTAGPLLASGSPAAATTSNPVTIPVATTSTSTVSLAFTCSTPSPVPLAGLGVSAALTVTAPTSVPAGSSFTVSSTWAISLPTALAGIFPSVGVTSDPLEAASLGVDATDATPTPQTDAAQGLPITDGPGIVELWPTTALAPLTFTASGPGTAVLTASTITESWTLIGGSYNGTDVVVTCTAGSGNPNLASIAVTSPPPPPTVSGISPTSGPEAGGASVTITGTGFTGATAVDFGSNAATSFTVDSDSSISAVSPPGTGTVDVTVTGPGGDSSVPANPMFIYTGATTTSSGGTTTTTASLAYTCSGLQGMGVVLPVPPVQETLEVTAPTSVVAGSSFTVSPTSTLRLDLGGGAVQITSTRLDALDLGVDATNASPATQTDDAQGLPVAVPSPDEPVSLSLAPLTFTAEAAGSPVVLTAGTLTVTATFTGSPVGGFTGTLSCTPAAGDPAMASIAVPVAPPPSITGISPTSGPTSGGTVVEITGSGLTGATAVDFGSTPAPSFTVGSDTSITAVSPPGAGQVDVTVTGPGATSATSAADRFTYGTPPSLLGMFPTRGPTLGYALVWVFGRDLPGLTSVTFGGNAALFRVFSPDLLIALAPPAASPGTVDVTLTNAAGPSAATPADQFTYVQQHCWFSLCFG